MLQAFGFSVVLLMAGLLIVPKVLPQHPTSALCKRVGEYWAIDKVFKLLQFLGLGLSAYLKTSTMMGLTGVSEVALEFQSLARIMRNTRKMFRFLRGGQLVLRIQRDWNPKTLNALEQKSKMVSNLAIFLFYLTDHFTFFSTAGLLEGNGRQQGVCELGRKFLMVFHVANFCRIFCLFVRHRNYTGAACKKIKKEFKNGVCDFVAHICDCTRILSVIFGWFAMPAMAFLAICSAIARLARL